MDTRIQGAPAPTKPSKRRMFVVWRCGQEGSQSCLPAAGTFIAALRPEIFGVTAHKPCTFPREEIACTDYRGAAFKLLAEIEQRQSKY